MAHRNKIHIMTYYTSHHEIWKYFMSKLWYFHGPKKNKTINYKWNDFPSFKMTSVINWLLHPFMLNWMLYDHFLQVAHLKEWVFKILRDFNAHPLYSMKYKVWNMGRYFMLHVCILCEIYGEHKWYANMIQYNIIAPGTLKPNSFFIAVLVSQYGVWSWIHYIS